MDAMIIDDEKHCRHVLSLLLARHCPEVNIVAECASGVEALAAIDIFKPQLLFLDIQMPGMNGRVHIDSDIRSISNKFPFPVSIAKDGWMNEYLENWGLIG